jgi:hypothetical protein
MSGNSTMTRSGPRRCPKFHEVISPLFCIWDLAGEWTRLGVKQVDSGNPRSSPINCGSLMPQVTSSINYLGHVHVLRTTSIHRLFGMPGVCSQWYTSHVRINLYGIRMRGYRVAIFRALVDVHVVNGCDLFRLYHIGGQNPKYIV